MTLADDDRLAELLRVTDTLDRPVDVIILLPVLEFDGEIETEEVADGDTSSDCAAVMVPEDIDVLEVPP